VIAVAKVKPMRQSGEKQKLVISQTNKTRIMILGGAKLTA